MRGWLVGLGVVGGLVMLSRRAAAAPGLPEDLDVADANGWIKLDDATGLAIRQPSRSWTSPAVRAVLLKMGHVAAQLGGELQVGDIGPEQRGSPFDPHKSHRWGRDMDLAYTLDDYPTPDEVPVDPRVVTVLESVADLIEVVGANATRVSSLEGHGFKVSQWPGHAHHLHLRLRSALVAEP